MFPEETCCSQASRDFCLISGRLLLKKGCHVWDLDERELIDMSIMDIGTNILGYGHPEVDAGVGSTVAAGNMSTLNCPEEVWLAKAGGITPVG